MRQLSELEKQRGRLLAHFLNRDLGEYKEVGAVLDGCRELLALYNSRPPAYPSPERRTYEMKQWALAGKVNAALRRFQIVLGVEVSELGLQPVYYLARPIRQKTVLAYITRTGARAFGPHSAVQTILEMMQAGTLGYIRQCENPECRKWLMVTSAKRTTCNDACRFAKFQMQKGSRANYMRENRKVHKNQPQLKKQRSGK